MTTIATDGKTMAGDGLTSINGTITSTVMVKVFRLDSGSIFGASGGMADILSVAEWLNNGGERPKVDSSFGGMLIGDEGVKCIDESLLPHPCQAPFASGSGADIALGAMLAGKSPAEAVAIAALRDVYTGGTIAVEALENI